MACDQGPCVVKEYEFDLPPAAPGASPPPNTKAIVTGSMKVSKPLPDGTLVDSTNATPEEAILAKLAKDFQKANEAQCKPGCKCVKNKNAKPEEGAYDVPISTTFKDGNSIRRAQGTVSVKTKDTPGKCFADPAFASLFPGVPQEGQLASMAEAMSLQTKAAAILASLFQASLADEHPLRDRPHAEKHEKRKPFIRAMLGVSLRTAPEGGLRVGAVLPGSAAEAAGLRPGDALTHLGETEVSNLRDARDAIADSRAPVTLSVAARRGETALQVEVTPAFCIFPFQSFSSGVKFNKFCDDNCDCTLDADGFLCTTVYVFVGNGPNGGVLLQKICGSQESGLPRIDTACDIGEYI
jgi:hypothetical protein